MALFQSLPPVALFLLALSLIGNGISLGHLLLKIPLFQSKTVKGFHQFWQVQLVFSVCFTFICLFAGMITFTMVALVALGFNLTTTFLQWRRLPKINKE